MNQFIQFLSRIEVIIAITVIILILIIWLIVRKVRSSGYKKQLADLEVRYNAIKSVPLPFKLNKAVAIARVDQEANQVVLRCKEDFDQATANLKQIQQSLADTEDNLIAGKLKPVKNSLLDLDSSISLGEEQVGKLDKFLDGILEKETAQRAEVTALKDRFREIKGQAQEKNNSLSYSWATIERNITNTEKKFSTFEEWMYASDFEKASGELNDIKSSLDNLEDIINNLPDLLQEARGVIPNEIETVNKDYAYEESRGVYLQHLDVDKNLGVITTSLKEDLERLKNGDATSVNEHLEDYKVRLKQLDEQIKKEGLSTDELKNTASDTAQVFVDAKENVEYVKNQYQKVSVRFGLEDLDTGIQECESKLEKLEINKDQITSLISTNSVPASTVMVNLKELNQDITGVNDELKAMKQKLDSATSDEDRARNQLLKLQLIMNEMQVKIRKNKLPSISDSYDVDLNKAYEYIYSIDKLVSETPINVELLNATLKDAIDFIYKLYNNVNNVVGMAVMVENAIVFGNKYRSTYADIDSELTRAELCFRNGEYTQALTIAIATIDKIHPGSYESLIKENAKSAA